MSLPGARRGSIVSPWRATRKHYPSPKRLEGFSFDAVRHGLVVIERRNHINIAVCIDVRRKYVVRSTHERRDIVFREGLGAVVLVPGHFVLLFLQYF